MVFFYKAFCVRCGRMTAHDIVTRACRRCGYVKK